ncbi:hypothetical protein ERX46_05930 [Brumimicrobium glaciale]|uniref:Uncharacterized protein n=1 Tax=Brumimicrobium glaciale TaxID=200475 RepID=A0A4Q4KNA1_9FLAO|nr:hypothetical protein [Brumimicrobium glaciale]RYM34913.1 hypothetical protein ERX46_05930 [Brumimicrobium glaciale]
MKFLSKNAIKLLLGLLTAITIFHICILLKIIPYDIAWGGRLQNDQEMYVFESISILVNLFLIWILLMRGNLVKFKFSNRIVNIILWIFFVIFILNTIGNVFAKTNFEKFFALVTGLFAFLLFRILKKT